MTESAQAAASNATSPRGWSRKKWAYTIAGGVVFGIVLNLLPPFENHLPPTGVLVPAYTIGLLASILAHEAGHLVAALLVKFEVLAFAVWPLQIHRTRKGWSVRMWRPGRSGIGGFVACYPAGTHDLVRRMLWIVAGGPVASWAVAISAAALAVFAVAPSQVWTTALLTALAFWSFAFGITSLLPNTGKYAASDGARIGKLLRGGPRAEQFVSLVVLLGDAVGGRRPRDWDPDLVRRAASPVEDTLDSISGQALRYNWLHDTRQLEEAGPLVEWVATRMPTKEGQNVWQLEVAWFQARHRGNTLVARQWFDRTTRAGKSPSARCAYFKAKAAIDLAEKQWHDAEVSAREVLKESDKFAAVGIALAIRDEAEAMLREVESAGDREKSPA